MPPKKKAKKALKQEPDYPPIIEVGQSYEIAEVGSVKVLDIITVVPNEDPKVSRQVDFDRYSSTMDIPAELLKGAKVTIKLPKSPREKEHRQIQMGLKEFAGKIVLMEDESINSSAEEGDLDE